VTVVAPKIIYADTSIWNCLCDQKVEAASLLPLLSAKHVQIVLGENVVTEFARTYQMVRADAGVNPNKVQSFVSTRLATCI
jgi:hypothetical protein